MKSLSNTVEVMPVRRYLLLLQRCRSVDLGVGLEQGFQDHSRLATKVDCHRLGIVNWPWGSGE